MKTELPLLSLNLDETLPRDYASPQIHRVTHYCHDWEHSEAINLDLHGCEDLLEGRDPAFDRSCCCEYARALNYDLQNE